MKTKAFVRVTRGEFEFLDVFANPPEWKRKSCPYQQSDTARCCDQCALFWYDGETVTLLCVRQTFSVIKGETGRLTEEFNAEPITQQ